MKCVKFAGSLQFRAGHVERLSNEEAATWVAQGVAIYVPKSEWKKQQRTPLAKV